ncbi:MAG TPA: hypothetical protein VFF73_33475, partial [Planctomycetota bacterium]|nr:hypothetical protein [Planctomycetota bacterium]
SRFWLLASGFLAVGLVATPVRAQELEVTVDAGWDGSFVEDAWTPLKVTLALPEGAKALRGRVVCEPVPLERVPGCSASFTLEPLRGARATAVVRLAAPARGDLSFTVCIEDENGREIGRGLPRDLPRRIDPRDRLVLLVGRKSGLSALEPRIAPRNTPPSKNDPGSARVARIAPEDLPDRSWLLGGTSAVFLADGPGMVELARDPARVAALESFARGGGTVVVIGGRGVAFWAGSALDALLPVAASGETAPAGARDLAFLGDEARPGLAVSQATLRAGAEDLTGREAGGHPLAARRRLGRGQVVFLAFDPDNPDVRAAPELPAFLARLAPSAVPKPPFARPDRLAEITTEELQERSPLGLLGLVGLGAATLAVLVLLGPVAVKRRHAPGRVVLAPALSALLSVAIVASASLGRGRAQAFSIVYAFAESDDDEALVLEDDALFAGSSTRFELELEGQATPVPLEASRLDLLALRAPGRTLCLEPGAKPRVAPIHVAAKGLAWLRAGSFVKLGARLAARAKEDALELDGRAALPAGVCAIVDPANHSVATAATPPLAPGETARVERASFATRTIWTEDGPPLWERSPAERTRAHLLRALEAVADEARVTAQPGKASRFPRAWVALPVPMPRLASIVEGGKTLDPEATVSVLLVAAEEP